MKVIRVKSSQWKDDKGIWWWREDVQDSTQKKMRWKCTRKMAE